MGDSASSIALISFLEQAFTKEEFGDQSAALEVARIPVFTVVCDERQGGSITSLDVGDGTRFNGQLFLQRDLALPDVPGLIFIDGNERWLAGGKQPVTLIERSAGNGLRGPEQAGKSSSG